MPIYTAEVGNRPVAAMQANSLPEAEAFFLSDAFSADLRMLEMKGGEPGKPIREGEAEIYVRESSPAEIALWQRFKTKAISEGVSAPNDAAFASFLDAVREINRTVESSRPPD